MAVLRMLALSAALLAGAVGGARADPFTLTSKTFKDGEAMPDKVADNRSGACHGDNISPQLSWTYAPAGAKTFVLAIIDPQGRNGLGVYHFVGYGIPASVTSFAEGELSAPSDKVRRRYEHVGADPLFRPVPAAGRAASLFLRAHRH